jgi:BirA family biotin operon repressor/biotin-[acetyl-CoA-carboxylase] ligase
MTKRSRIRRIHLAEVDSTMEATRQEIAKASNVAPDAFVLVTADAQTAGRGTRGRPWHSPRGNVYLTLAVPRSFLPPARLGLFPLEAGIALWDATVSCLAPQARPGLRLKWPNDLLWDGRKTAGMLIEASGEHVYVGIGINVAEAPPVSDGGTPSARLADAGAGEDAGGRIAEAFAEILRARLETAENASGVIDAWRARAAWNRPFRLRDRAGAPLVAALDVNDSGHLKVRHDDGQEEWLISDYLA